MSGENLGERISLEGPADELKQLADTFDGMLGRLDGAFASQRHFVANASHELRTPLAIMRTEVDVSLADPDATVEELRRMGDAVRETVDRCERLIEGLLMLARSEAATGREEPADLAALAADCVTDLRARAREADVEVRDDLEPAWTRGEPALLERMIANLVDNGIRHNRPGGFLTRDHADLGRPRAGDRGQRRARIDPADADKLTEPFRRLDRGGGGFGLGLVDRALGGRGAWRHDPDRGARSGRTRGPNRFAGAAAGERHGAFLRGPQECLRKADTPGATTLKDRALRIV